MSVCRRNLRSWVPLKVREGPGRSGKTSKGDWAGASSEQREVCGIIKLSGENVSGRIPWFNMLKEGHRLHIETCLLL